MQQLKAVKAGKRFNLFREELLEGIELEKTCVQIRVNRTTYDLYHGKNIEDSKQILRLLKTEGGILVSAYRIN